MKKFLILFFMVMTVFVLPSFASPTGGGDSVLELSGASFVNADLSLAESQVELINTEMDFTILTLENIVPLSRSKTHIMSTLSAMEINIKLKSLKRFILVKTTMNELSGNLIRYVRLAA